MCLICTPSTSGDKEGNTFMWRWRWITHYVNTHKQITSKLIGIINAACTELAIKRCEYCLIDSILWMIQNQNRWKFTKSVAVPMIQSPNWIDGSYFCLISISHQRILYKLNDWHLLYFCCLYDLLLLLLLYVTLVRPHFRSTRFLFYARQFTLA